MIINGELIEQIINFGALEYDFEKISIITGIEKSILVENYKNKDSDFYKLYEKGRVMSDFAIDLKLFQLSKAGDLKALDKLELRKRSRR